jgi:hypothetical protein
VGLALRAWAYQPYASCHNHPTADDTASAYQVRSDAMTNPHAFPLEPTQIRVSHEVLDDLRARLALTRAPLGEGNEDWSYGVPESYLREPVAYWRDATSLARRTGATDDDRDEVHHGARHRAFFSRNGGLLRTRAGGASFPLVVYNRVSDHSKMRL